VSRSLLYLLDELLNHVIKQSHAPGADVRRLFRVITQLDFRDRVLAAGGYHPERPKDLNPVIGRMASCWESGFDEPQILPEWNVFLLWVDSCSLLVMFRVPLALHKAEQLLFFLGEPLTPFLVPARECLLGFPSKRDFYDSDCR
jgi:hypothetical protein